VNSENSYEYVSNCVLELIKSKLPSKTIPSFFKYLNNRIENHNEHNEQYEKVYLGVLNLLSDKPKNCTNTMPLLYYFSKFLSSNEAASKRAKIIWILPTCLSNINLILQEIEYLILKVSSLLNLLKMSVLLSQVQMIRDIAALPVLKIYILNILVQLNFIIP